MAKDFIKRFREVAPFPIDAIQTDNGKEFHKYFREYLKTEQITHYYNYPKCPKMNTFVERFNRTIQDQHISQNMHLLYGPDEANQKLMRYLIWYNTEKPHRGIAKFHHYSILLTHTYSPKSPICYGPLQ